MNDMKRQKTQAIQEEEDEAESPVVKMALKTNSFAKEIINLEDDDGDLMTSRSLEN